MVSTIARLFSANLLIQAIPFLSSPLLAYIYDLSVFGVFATVVSVTALIGCFSSGRLERALIIASSDKAASVTASSALILVFLMVLVTAIFVFVLSFFVTLNKAYYFIPLVLLVAGTLPVIMALANRKKQYKLMIKSRLAGAVTRNVLMLIFGLFNPGVFSLLLGHIVGTFLEILLVVKVVEISVPTKARFAWCICRYKKFLKMTTSSSFFENLSSAGLPALFSLSLGESEAGAIAMAQRLLEKPVGALSKAVSEVFKVSFQKDCPTIRDKKKLYRRFFIGLLSVGIAPFFVAYIWGQQAVLLIVGEDWALVAQYIEILLVVYFLSFVVGSVSSILFAFENLASELIVQFSIALGVLVVFLVLPPYIEGQNELVKMFAAVVSVKYFAMLFLIELAFTKKLKG